MASVDSSRDSSVQSKSQRSARKSSAKRGATPSVALVTLDAENRSQKPAARTSLAHPDARISVREEILALAGVDKTRLAELARKAVARVDEAMDATKITHHTYQGEVIDESIDVDHRARMDGVDRALDLFGGRVSKSAQDNAPSGPTNVNVFIAGPNGPVPVHAEVVEAEPAT